MERIKYTKNNAKLVIKKALAVLKKGGLFVFPTETCYGLGADATKAAAIKKLYSYKSRREGKPLSIAVSDIKMAEKYVEINAMAENLYKNYLPGPITVISKGLGKVASGVESEYGTLGIRIPDHKLILEIVKNFGKPITATSANMSYLPKPYDIESLIKNTPAKNLKLIDLIIDAGKLPHRETSTVVDTTMNSLNVLRAGQINLAKKSAKRAGLAAQTNSAAQTVDFGSMNMLKYIDEPLDKPLVFFLMGELGAGKTQFSKGLARELKIKEIIKSPTFTILNEHEYKFGKRRGKFIHADTWRIENLKDMETIGLNQYFTPGNVIAIEWADKFSGDLEKKIKKAGGKIIKVVFEHTAEEVRDIKTYE
jgi:tRNA threonylcarbamoyl adenosine modification protein (Sua5/YciO/YrdC/YwlC family)/tRNA threonylcarbamoyl adenosine modification protein YjeE